MYYGKVEEVTEYDNKEDAHYNYWDKYNNAYGGVNLYIDGVLIEGEKKIIEALGPKPRKQFVIPPKEAETPDPYPYYYCTK